MPEQLTSVEEQVLRIAVLRYAEEPFTSEALEEADPGRMTGFAAEVGIDRLRRRGVIETRKKAWGEVFHTLAPGLLTAWQRTLVPALGDPRGCALEDDEVEPVVEPTAGFAKMLLSFLAMAANEGLALTQKGTFHKKDIQRIQSRIAAAEERLAGLDIHYMHEDKLGKSVAIVYDAALRLQLLRSGVSKAELREDALRAWLSQPRRRTEEQLLQLWWEVYTPNDVWLQHCAAALRNLPDGKWCGVEQVCSALLDAGVPANGRSREEARSVLQSYWLEPMAALGWLELGGRARREAPGPAESIDAVRKRGFSEDEDGWYVQQDFEVIVPPTVPLASLWNLEACAEYAGGDTVERYKITKDSWQRALGRGWDGVALLEALAAGAAFPVPETVRTVIEQWSASYGAVVVEDVALLRCKHSRDATFLLKDESTAPYIRTQLTELDFIVSKPHVKQLIEALKKRGFTPRIVEDRGETVEPAGQPAALGTSSGGIIYSRRNAALFPLDAAPEGVERLREKLDQVPQAWLSSFRKYHPSTLRELVETAIDMRISVKLSVNGQEAELVPKQLRRSGKDWVVQGYIDGQAADVGPEEVGEIKLIVPEQP